MILPEQDLPGLFTLIKLPQQGQKNITKLHHVKNITCYNKQGKFYNKKIQCLVFSRKKCRMFGIVRKTED